MGKNKLSHQYTPGLWHVGAGLMVCAADGSPVARCSATRGKYELEEPNCYLIAAAPELLVAVEELVQRCESDIRNEYEGTSMYRRLLAELQPYRDLINKAIGGA